MPSIPVPTVSGVDLITDAQKVQQLIDLLFALRNINVQLVVGQASQTFSPGVSPIVGTPPALILPLPLKLATPIADSTATAASVSTQLNLLLAALRANGMLPQ